MSIIINLDKAKAIAHDIRRQQRAAEFKPFDEIIAKQIPVISATGAEALREAIRERYADLQDAINAAESPDEIKAALQEVIS